MSTPPPVQHPFEAPPTPPPRPRRGHWGWLAALGVFLLCGFLSRLPGLLQNVLPSGVKYEGRNVSRREFVTAMREIERMGRTAKAGDPSSYDLSFKPSTEVGRAFKDFLLQSKKVEDDYAKKIGGNTAETLLVPERLGTSAGRAKSERQLRALREATKTYFAQSRDVVRSLYELTQKMGVDNPAVAASVEAEVGEMESLGGKMLDAAGRLLELGEEAKPVYNAKSGIVEFETDEQVARYNRLIDAYNAAVEEQQKGLARILKVRQRKMAEGLSKLRDLSTDP